MKIRYNVQAIMAYANRMVREQLVRDQQFISVGQKPPHTNLRDIGYCLKQAWLAAKADRYYILDGITAGGHGLCIVMED